MIVVVNLKDRPLKATACGSCQGSSSDNTIRTAPTPAPASVTDTPATLPDK